MIEFLYLFLFRALSGAQNGAGYAKQQTLRVIITFTMCTVLIGTVFTILYQPRETPWEVFAVLLILISTLGAVGVEDSFNPSYQYLPKDIHFWEMLATGGITLAWVLLGGNLIGIAASVYPGLILHKGFVNLGSGKGWWYAGTDDRTGKTFSIPLLGIKVPRLNTRGRVHIAVISILAMIVNHTTLHWKISLQDIGWL